MSEAIGTREFAEKFGVTPATVSKWCREGKIPDCNQDGKGSPGQKGSGTVNKRLTNCEQIFEKSRMASNENS